MTTQEKIRAPAWFRWGVAITGVMLVASLCSKQEAKAPSMAAQYPGPWRNEFNLEMARALVKNHVRGCGEYQYRHAAASSNEFLLYCSRDGVAWSAYLLWLPSGEVMGPLKISEDIPPP